jgi:hypothetical protein
MQGQPAPSAGSSREYEITGQEFRSYLIKAERSSAHELLVELTEYISSSHLSHVNGTAALAERVSQLGSASSRHKRLSEIIKNMM